MRCRTGRCSRGRSSRVIPRSDSERGIFSDVPRSQIQPQSRSHEDPSLMLAVALGMTTTELREQQDRMARIGRIEKMTASASESRVAGGLTTGGNTISEPLFNPVHPANPVLQLHVAVAGLTSASPSSSPILSVLANLSCSDNDTFRPVAIDGGDENSNRSCLADSRDDQPALRAWKHPRPPRAALQHADRPPRDALAVARR